MYQARGRGGGYGQGWGNQGRGRGGGAGPGGNCLCPACGHKIPHPRGTPCSQISCPKCGTPMIRE
ncbi:MAG: hypothetical protein DRI99_02195 [Candidatus Aminicenantes bacterium]|nr:hypothetical protein [Candidatus Aminicenantes bacterium]RLE02712.1 MAG: hypothetical protein DRJ11_06430 [Candidatus Aminicenantes bacterium]RLE05386.1 MAG: hypothetical protein DRI99_02195 [Candidatus Aminicenantes bacterium]HHF42132.1 hypothetical protein [Candidatus Aminicenantes bacterium]